MGCHNLCIMQAQPIEFAVIDVSAGYEATPERVRLELLETFAADVSKLLRGAQKEVDPGQLDVAVRSGSLSILTEPIIGAPTLFRDLRWLLQSDLLDALDVKRREVIERWQKVARQAGGVAFRITAPALERPLIIDERSDYRADDADQWVVVERYVRGEIQNLGGAKAVNAHVRLPTGVLLTVATDRTVLKNDTHNRLYKQAMLRIKARYNVLTQELRDAQLIEFVEYEPQFDEADMDRLTRRGAQAWKDVGDAAAWVEDFRGGLHRPALQHRPRDVVRLAGPLNAAR